MTLSAYQDAIQSMMGLKAETAEYFVDIGEVLTDEQRDSTVQQLRPLNEQLVANLQQRQQIAEEGERSISDAGNKAVHAVRNFAEGQEHQSELQEAEMQMNSIQSPNAA